MLNPSLPVSKPSLGARDILTVIGDVVVTKDNVYILAVLILDEKISQCSSVRNELSRKDISVVHIHEMQ